MPSPLRFHPYLRPMVWGGRGLGELLHKHLPDAALYGEAWEISDHGSHQSIVADGPAAGRTLRALLADDPAPLLGDTDEAGFPWLIKYLDAHDWLSVQVHPDEAAVRRLWPGENSKTEAWFVLAARPGSRVYTGLRPGVDEAILRGAVADGTVADCLYSYEPRPGDCIFLPAGTVHAVGGGVLIAEVQQSSDATFRLFDWGRRDAHGQARRLHLEEAIASIHWNAGPVDPLPARGYPRPGQPSARDAVRQELVRCRYFHLDYVRQSEPFRLAGCGQMQTLLVLHGRGRYRSDGGLHALVAGDTVLLPAALPPLWIEPSEPLGLLLSTLPAPALARRGA